MLWKIEMWNFLVPLLNFALRYNTMCCLYLFPTHSQFTLLMFWKIAMWNFLVPLLNFALRYNTDMCCLYLFPTHSQFLRFLLVMLFSMEYWKTWVMAYLLLLWFRPRQILFHLECCYSSPLLLVASEKLLHRWILKSHLRVIVYLYWAYYFNPFFTPIRISGKWKSHLWSHATLNWMIYLYKSGTVWLQPTWLYRMQSAEFYLAGFGSLLCLPKPVVDTSVNLIYFFMWMWKFCNFFLFVGAFGKTLLTMMHHFLGNFYVLPNLDLSYKNPHPCPCSPAASSAFQLYHPHNSPRQSDASVN